MAQIIDAININRSRFTKWAQEWLHIQSELYYGGYIRDIYIQPIIEKLLENKVFTVEQLRAEFKNKKIFIPEIVMNKAIERSEKK